MMPMRFLPLTAHSAWLIIIVIVKLARRRWHYHQFPNWELGRASIACNLVLWAMRSWPRCADNFADGHTASNKPDLFRPPKLSGAGPG